METKRKPRTQALGEYGERLAARYLSNLGLVVLDRNWRCRAGEIDLVLRERRTLVICEVKTRTSLACGTPHEAVGPERLERLHRLGEEWLATHPGIAPDELRIDLVAVLRPRRGLSTIEHVPGLG